VHEEHVGPLRAKTIDRLLAAMGRAVVHDPENATCWFLRLLAHDFRNQAIDRSNAGFLFAAAEHLGPMHIPGSQIGAPGSSLRRTGPRRHQAVKKKRTAEMIRQLRNLGYRIEAPNPQPSQAQAQWFSTQVLPLDYRPLLPL
jgi:hypothetical protein